MKKYILLFFILPFFFACSDDDKDETQDYTSFVIMQNHIESQANVIIGYRVDNKYKKIAELGDLKKGVWSEEVILKDESINEIYIFSDYPYPSIKTDKVFVLKKNIINKIEIPSNVKGIPVDDVNDPTQYPQ